MPIHAQGCAGRAADGDGTTDQGPESDRECFNGAFLRPLSHRFVSFSWISLGLREEKHAYLCRDVVPWLWTSLCFQRQVEEYQKYDQDPRRFKSITDINPKTKQAPLSSFPCQKNKEIHLFLFQFQGPNGVERCRSSISSLRSDRRGPVRSATSGSWRPRQVVAGDSGRIFMEFSMTIMT